MDDVCILSKARVGCTIKRTMKTTRKTTTIQLLANKLKPDDTDLKIPDMSISFKPQKISPKFKGTVEQLVLAKIKSDYLHTQFQTDVFKHIDIDCLNMIYYQTVNEYTRMVRDSTLPFKMVGSLIKMTGGG